MGKKTSQEQLELVELFNSRTDSVKEFCELHGVKYHNLRYWMRKMAKNPVQKKESFVPIKIERVSRKGWLEIHTNKGLELVINEPVSADFIKSLLD
jgi:hypothetical protein